jgi:hypothetical protein
MDGQTEKPAWMGIATDALAGVPNPPAPQPPQSVQTEWSGLWVSVDCDEGAILETLKECESKGYEPRLMSPVMVQDTSEEPPSWENKFRVFARQK